MAKKDVAKSKYERRKCSQIALNHGKRLADRMLNAIKCTRNRKVSVCETCERLETRRVRRQAIDVDRIDDGRGGGGLLTGWKGGERNCIGEEGIVAMMENIWTQKRPRIRKAEKKHRKSV